MSVMPSRAVRMPYAAAAIRPLCEADVGPLKSVVEATDMFPPHMLDDMVAGYLSGASSDRWLTALDEVPIGVAYYVPERLTEGTWNLLLVAVHPEHQSRGCGAALLTAVERDLAHRGQRLLVVETSGLAGFRRTRDFYLRCGYAREAVIRDFYQPGEDKVVFRKALA